ncbi:MAG: polysaccharide lyase family 8 super-sandwich domain-containing protein, partial [Acutalibacteraceae bacterium]
TDIRPQSGNPYSGATTGGSVGVFFFDDEYVMLGADIHSNHKAPIHTTINQTLAGDVSVNGVPVASGTADADYQADYVYNNKIGYIFPETTAVKVSNQDQTGLNITQWDQNAVDTPDTFTLYVDHGVAPKEASYACIVLPNATAEQVADYSQNNRDVVIVANNKEVQAVRHDGLKQTQVLFYKAGQLEYAPGKTVQADGPCSLIIDESGDAPLITEAVSNRDPGTVRTVYLTVDGQTSRTVYESGATPYAGQSVTQTAGDSVFITAGQSLTGTVGAAFDGDDDTAWVAASAEDSWIRYDMRDALDLDGITIRFGDSYPSKYDLLVSNDGEKWDTVYSEENGNGGEDMIPLDTTARYWKLECREIVAADVEKGDVDGKDGVTAADALMALQAATGKIALTAAQEQSADVDGQPGVSAADALMILQIATGKIAPVSAPSNGGVAIKEIVFTDKDFALATPEYPAMTALEQAIGKTVRAELYSEETLAVYRAALRKAQKLLVLPYATAAMVNAMTDELSAAIAGLQYGDLGSVMATLTYDNPTFTGHKVTMGTPWASFDNMVDLSDRDLSKIYLFFTVNFALSGGERAGMFSSGRILLRSPNTDGKENNAYATIGNYGWHEGENVVYLPLSAMTGQTNQMDWGAVNTFRLYVDSLNQYDMDVTLTISPVQILDSEHRKPDSEAKIQLRALIKEQRTDLELYTLESIAAYNDLYEEAAALYKNAEADDDAVNAMIARLQASDDLLVLDEDAKDLLGIICAEEKTSSVAHRMDLTINADEPIDLSGYTADELYLQFDLRVDTSHVDPAPKDDYWLTYVKNGKVELGAVAKGDRVVAIPQLHSTQYLSRSGSFVTIRKPLPADLVAQGQVQTFFMFLYNDTGNLGVGE